MKFTPTAIDDVKLVQLTLHHDARGFFVERFREEIWRTHMPQHPLVQINHSFSKPGVLRGLHVQHSPQQGKLVGVTRGCVLDIAVDVRPGSPSFGKHVAVELSAENGRMLWIPPGFAHGFCVLGDQPADVVYHVSAYYHAGGELGIRYDDPALALPWPVSQPLVSKKDAALPTLDAVTPTLMKVCSV